MKTIFLFLLCAISVLLSTETYGQAGIKVQDGIGHMIDTDGNLYHTVIIGDQEWVAENLRVMHYRNGDSIPNVTGVAEWDALTTGAYCWYNNDEATYKDLYGALYNWFAVDDSRNLCPSGWHVPSDAEWATLTTFLGGENIAGGKMKSAALWDSPNIGATNTSGFSGRPGGYRLSNSSFINIGIYSYWWTSTEKSKDPAWHRFLLSGTARIHRFADSKGAGFSVRCLKDN